jgi:hypothetical protein
MLDVVKRHARRNEFVVKVARIYNTKVLVYDLNYDLEYAVVVSTSI